MTHWGWYWKVKKQHEPKKLCSHFCCVDSFKMFKERIIGFTLNPGTFYAHYLENHFKVDFIDGPLKGKSYKLAVEKQPCNFGGFRYFFHCPACSKRMRKLYNNQGILLCRKCLNLGYYSQRLVPSVRCSIMQSRIEDSLDSRGGSIIEKPKWMRKHTFKKLKNRYWDYEFKQEEAMLREAREMFGISLF